MKKRNFETMTKAQKRYLINKYEHLMENCSNTECEDCPFFWKNFDNLPTVLFKGRGLTCGKIYNRLKFDISSKT